MIRVRLMGPFPARRREHPMVPRAGARANRLREVETARRAALGFGLADRRRPAAHRPEGGRPMTNPADLLRPMFRDALEMLTLASSAFRRQDTAGLQMADALGEAIHKHEQELTERLLEVQPEPEGLRFVPAHLERI